MTVPDSTLLNEQTLLRAELQGLKKCQIQYFLLSVSATGALFGLKSDLSSTSGLVNLAPLLIILPCWLTIFDKANTITRLTGYMSVFIEDQLKINAGNRVYLGYENALAIFRRMEEKGIVIKIDKPFIFIFRRLINVTRHQYRKINWATFLLLSLVCCFYPFFKTRSSCFLHDPIVGSVYSLFYLAELVSIILTAMILFRLIFGRYSYENVRSFWEEIHINH